MSDHLKAFEAHIAEQARQKGIPEERALRRFKSFAEYANEAADKLGFPPEADACRSYASIKVSLDAIIEAQMLNKHVDPANHLRLIEALKDVLPQEAPRQHTVKIQLVDGFALCPKCREVYERSCPTALVERDSATADVPAPITTNESGGGETLGKASGATVEGPVVPAEPVKLVPRFAPPEPEKLFSACTIGKGVQTSDRWSR